MAAATTPSLQDRLSQALALTSRNDVPAHLPEWMHKLPSMSVARFYHERYTELEKQTCVYASLDDARVKIKRECLPQVAANEEMAKMLYSHCQSLIQKRVYGIDHLTMAGPSGLGKRTSFEEFAKAHFLSDVVWDQKTHDLVFWTYDLSAVLATNNRDKLYDYMFATVRAINERLHDVPPTMPIFILFESIGYTLKLSDPRTQLIGFLLEPLFARTSDTSATIGLKVVC
jgi:hypothetical protein